MSQTPALPPASTAHPLLYASLTPIESNRGLPSIDLYKPKAKYNLGRSPESDVVLESQYFEWSYCTLLWDGKDEVSITDLFSVNGVWINRRRIAPGEPHILRDGDTVFFAMCGLEKPEEDYEIPRYELGDDYAYIYHQYTDRPPPLAPDHQDSWTRLDELERSRRRIENELDKLKRERDVILQETQSIIGRFPALPPPVHSDFAEELKEAWTGWSELRNKQPASIILPEDFRELFRPDTDDLPYYPRWRNDYQTLNRVRPPPLPWGPPAGGWTKCYHRSEGPDWNHPDLVWDGLMPLDQSRPLTIPPSIIYWSAKFKLPVYAHPRFEPGSSRIYARSYSMSTDGFSDYSAAEQRRKLKLPPLEDPPIVRPRQVLYSLDCQWCPDEDELAAKVSALLPTLRPDDDLLSEPSPSPTYSPGSTPLTRFAVFIKDYPDTLENREKRKRECCDGDDKDEDSVSPAPSARHSPVNKDERSRDIPTPSTKRRKIDASSQPSPGTDAPGAASLEGAIVFEESLGSASVGDAVEAHPS